MMQLPKREKYEFEIIYQPKEKNEEKVRIFGTKFVKRNKNLSLILYKDKEYELKEFFEDIDNNYNHKDKFLIQFKEINNIIDLSYMFCGCESLLSIKELTHSNTLEKFEKKDNDFEDINIEINDISVKDHLFIMTNSTPGRTIPWN